MFMILMLLVISYNDVIIAYNKVDIGLNLYHIPHQWGILSHRLVNKTHKL